MNKNDNTFEFNAPTTFANLYELANDNDDGADKFFGKSPMRRFVRKAPKTLRHPFTHLCVLLDVIVEKLQNAKSEPNLGIVKQESNDGGEDGFEENKENLTPDDDFDDRNIK